MVGKQNKRFISCGTSEKYDFLMFFIFFSCFVFLSFFLLVFIVFVSRDTNYTYKQDRFMDRVKQREWQILEDNRVEGMSDNSFTLSFMSPVCSVGISLTASNRKTWKKVSKPSKSANTWNIITPVSQMFSSLCSFVTTSTEYSHIFHLPKDAARCILEGLGSDNRGTLIPRLTTGWNGNIQNDEALLVWGNEFSSVFRARLAN